MPRRSTVAFENISVSAAQDLFEVTPADDKPIKLISVVGSFRDDETNEQLSITVKRFSGAYTSGSGGSAPTPTKVYTGDPTVGYSAERNNTTRATGGTSETLHAEGFPGQGGFAVTPLPGSEWVATQGEALVVGLENAPGAARNFNCTITIEEMP